LTFRRRRRLEVVPHHEVVDLSLPSGVSPSLIVMLVVLSPQPQFAGFRPQASA